jgi:hypothetical protein
MMRPLKLHPLPASFSAIPGLALYGVSRDGRVFSRCMGREMRQRQNRTGYMTVFLVDDTGRDVHRFVHVLMLLSFVGPKPAGYCTRHLNGKRHDNRMENLAYGTHSENSLDRYEHGTMFIGEKNHKCKITADDVREIRAAKASGKTKWGAMRFARRLGVIPSHITDIANGVSWRHIK